MTDKRTVFTFTVESPHNSFTLKEEISQVYASDQMTVTFDMLQRFEQMLAAVYPGEYQAHKEGF